MSDLPFNNLYEEGRIALSYSEIKQNLKLPIPQNLIRQKPQGRMNIDYVNVTDLKDLMDERAGIWTVERIGYFQTGNQVICVLSVCVHAIDGIYSQEANGIEQMNLDSYGDTASNSYAQAFRRACESHGLGRELWRKDEIAAGEYAKANPQQPAQQQQKPASQTQQTQQQRPATTQVPAQSSGQTESKPPASIKQIGYIESLCISKGLNQELLSLERYGVELKKINKFDASDFIKYLSEYEPGN